MTDSVRPRSAPRISIVVPSFNQAQFIAQTLASVIDQGYPNLELMVVDGGSTDSSVDVIRGFSEHLAYWVSEPDHGQTHAINKGMARATGELRAYLNSDDLLLPGALESIARAFAENPDVDIFHGRCRTIDEEGMPLPKVFHAEISSPSEILDLWRVWFRGKNFVQPEVFWTARLAERIGDFDERFNYAMDYDYWRRAIVSGARVCRIDHDVAAFRIWSAQKSSAADKAADELRVSAHASLLDPSVQIPWTLRQRLLADWEFDEVFRKSAGDMSDQSRLGRRAALLGVSVEHPRLFLSRGFRNHALKRASGWMGLSS